MFGLESWLLRFAYSIVLRLASLTIGDWWAYGSAGVVFVGVVGESVADLTDWVQPQARRKKLEIGAALVLILGLAGDIVSIHVTELATAVLNKEAGDARKAAGLADERAEKAEAEAQSVRLRADALELQIADRHITLEQRKEMLAVLKQPPGGARIAIGYITNSGNDSLPYSLELAEVFCDAKWMVFQPMELISVPKPIHGFMLDFQTGASSKRLADLVRKALAVTGHEVLLTEAPPGLPLGGNASLCRASASPTPPPWNPAEVEILVGGK